MIDQLNLRIARGEDDPILALVIRQAFEEFDAPRLGTVFSDPTTDHLFQFFQIPGAILRVATMNEEVLGCCGVYPTAGLEPDTAELAKFYILAKARGKGIGKSLMLQCIASTRELGYKKLYLESLPHFAKAVSMYERSGFRKIEGPLGESGHTSCNIWMIRDL